MLDALDAKGFVKVTSGFKVIGYANVFAFGDCCDFDSNKSIIRVKDQLPTVVMNIAAFLEKRPLFDHKKGASMNAQIVGAPLVALGHGLPGKLECPHTRQPRYSVGADGYGLGPNLPGCPGLCCWLCCCCSTPAGSLSKKMKTDFNKSVKPQPGKGIDA